MKNHEKPLNIRILAARCTAGKAVENRLQKLRISIRTGWLPRLPDYPQRQSGGYNRGTIGEKTKKPKNWPKKYILLHMAIQAVLAWQNGAETYFASKWAPGLQFSVSPNSEIFSDSWFSEILEFQCTRNGSQNLPFCPGSLQDTFIIYSSISHQHIFPKIFPGKIKTENLKIWKFENLNLKLIDFFSPPTPPTPPPPPHPHSDSHPCIGLKTPNSPKLTPEFS